MAPETPVDANVGVDVNADTETRAAAAPEQCSKPLKTLPEKGEWGRPVPPPGHFLMLYFATAKLYTGKQWEFLPAPLRLKDLFASLESRYGGMKEQVLDFCLVTINYKYVNVPDGGKGDVDSDMVEAGGDVLEAGDVVINADDEVALIPPVSSG